MKFSEKWLREWVNPAVTSDELVAQLTMAGLEVDSAEPAAPPFEKIVVGRVVSVQPHPDADKLRVTRVEVGEGEPIQIVCGAPNVHEGMLAPCALVGARLPGDFKIKKSKLRGVESLGMLCSAKELGLAESAEGLMPLPADALPGTDIRDYLGLDDTVIEVDLTPNRGDCLGLAGIAREVGVLNRAPVQGPAMESVAATSDATFPVRVEAPADCPRYLGRVVEGIDPKAATPMWMKERLRRGGIRSLGFLIDVTNYVLLELGQPMHAFDLRRLGGEVVVRRAVAGERLTLLDGKEIELDPEVLVIADREQVLALAGVMGGEASGVADDSDTLFLECAFFNPETIAGRARRFGMQTDSSFRFERGVDFRLQARAMERATALILEIAGGRAGPVIEVVSEVELPRREAVLLREARIERLLGMAFAPAEVEEILGRAGMELERTGEGWRVTPPSFRFDIAIEADLIEELGRIHGYDNLPVSTPKAVPVMLPASEAKVGQGRIRQVLVDRGYQEAITYSFVDPQLQALLDPENEPVALANPLSSELSVMRTSLWPGLVKAAQYNLNRQQARIRMFETGLKFVRQANEIKQESYIAAVLSGAVEPEQWGTPARAADFYDLKGDLEALLGLGGQAEAFRFVPAGHPALHPGQCARIERDGEAVGWIGALHPELQARLDLPGGVLLFELEMAALRRAEAPRFRELSKFPAIRRDLAVVVDEEVAAEAVRRCVAELAGPVLSDLRLFDVYRGQGIESNRKSLALGLILQDSSRTLTDQDVDEVTRRVVDGLQQQLGASLRD